MDGVRVQARAVTFESRCKPRDSRRNNGTVLLVLETDDDPVVTEREEDRFAEEYEPISFSEEERLMAEIGENEGKQQTLHWFGSISYSKGEITYWHEYSISVCLIRLQKPQRMN